MSLFSKIYVQHYFSGYNTTRAKFENDDRDFNVSRIIDEVDQIMYYPSVNKSGSILFMNFGLHFSESTTFSNYKLLITELLKLLKRKDFYKGKIIWRTTTSLNQHKLGGKHQHSRRFLTHQVSTTLNISLNWKGGYSIQPLYQHWYQSMTSRLRPFVSSVTKMLKS